MVKGVGMKKPCPSTLQQRNKLQQFRQAIYAQVFTQARDALFELLEALLVHSRVASFVELCLAAVFRRQWASAYAALRDGRIDPDALERLLVAQVPATGTAVFALDATLWPHRQAKTLAERQWYPVHGSGPEIVAGHAYSLLAWVVERGTSWALPLSTRRLPPEQTARAVRGEPGQRLCTGRKEQAPARPPLVTSE